MGVSKTDLFTEEQNNISLLAKALGHPARVAIIEYLLKIDSCICGDIVDEIGLAQPTVSQHLKELKNAKIIKGNIEGKAICYCIDEETITKFHHYFGNMITNLNNKKTDCC
ncbi:metalloregulator ArsR/SmtB family transcription factor [Flavobacterium sp.]|uniref:ArsR/SmtB family transcription factor n=1 Tax=Flavobacterium sp. TaxID=239 RepID=UPI0028BF292E|nr:metalloregulator ArsR/SmtB family transcription factor [Flavobacterium sp.]